MSSLRKRKHGFKFIIARSLPTYIDFEYFQDLRNELRDEQLAQKKTRLQVHHCSQSANVE
jgi:hypothetical protein